MLVDNRSGKWATPCLYSVTLMMVAAVLGILAGELITDYTRAAEFSGLAATVVAIVLGIRVWITAWRSRELLVIMAIPAIWIANISYSFNVSDPAVDIMFDISTTLVMFVFYRHVHEHLLLCSKTCCTPRRRQEDKILCAQCSRPCGKEVPK
jgi:cytochrome c oxidase assembly factor CtaG